MKHSTMLVFVPVLVVACKPMKAHVGNIEDENTEGPSAAFTDDYGPTDCGQGPTIEPVLSVAPPSGDPSDSYDESAMLQNVHRIVQQVYERFKTDARALECYIDAYCDDLDAGVDTSSSFATMEAAFDVAVHTWSVAEMMTMGPSANRGSGEALRDHVYSWKEAKAPCAVDHELATLYADPSSYTLPVDNPQFKGMDALEYLLFTELDTACNTRYSPKEPPDGWSSISAGDKAKARCRYAARVADVLVDDAEAIASRWAQFEQDFLTGTFNQDERRSLDGVELVYHALALYVDKKMKELKVYMPFGKEVMNLTFGYLCGWDQACPEELEASFSKKSRELMMANFVGHAMLFYGVGPDGVQGQGFRDMLYAAQGTSEPTDGDPLTGPQIQSAIATAVSDVSSELNNYAGTTLYDAISGGDPGSDLIDAFNDLTVLYRDHIGKGSHSSGGITDMVLPKDMDGDVDG